MKKWSDPSVVSRWARVLRALAAAAVVIGVGLTAVGAGGAATNNGGSALAGAPTRTGWRHQMQHLKVPVEGCFAGWYPSVSWQQVPCLAAPDIPLVPRIVSRDGVRAVAGPAVESAAGPVREQVGGHTTDYSARVTSGTISSATGSFPYVSPGSSEALDVAGLHHPDEFTVQLNTQCISGSPACAGASDPSQCLAWQQFVYLSDFSGPG
jgi:hypothetical protein